MGRLPDLRALFTRFSHARPVVHIGCLLAVVIFVPVALVGAHLFVTNVILGENPPKLRAFNSLRPGMTKTEVSDQLGAPEETLSGDNSIWVEENVAGSGLTRLSPYRRRRVEAAGGAWVYWNHYPYVECHVLFDDTGVVQEVVVTDRD